MLEHISAWQWWAGPEGQHFRDMLQIRYVVPSARPLHVPSLIFSLLILLARPSGHLHACLSSTDLFSLESLEGLIEEVASEWTLERQTLLRYSFTSWSKSSGNLTTPFLIPPVSSICKQDSTSLLPSTSSALSNQDSLGSHSMSIIYLMNKVGNPDELLNCWNYPSAKWRWPLNLP